MVEETFEQIVKALGVELDSKRRNALISNAYGEFRIHLVTGHVLYRPLFCSYCEDQCDFMKRVCIVPYGRSWSNVDLNRRQLLILAEIYTIKNEQFDSRVVLQLPKYCIKDPGAKGRGGAPRFPSDAPVFARERLRRAIQRLGAGNLPLQHLKRLNQEADKEYAMAILGVWCVNLQIPEGVKARARHLYQFTKEMRMTWTCSIETMICAILYLACHEHRVPLELEDLEQFAGIPRKTIGFYYEELLSWRRLQ